MAVIPFRWVSVGTKTPDFRDMITSPDYSPTSPSYSPSSPGYPRPIFRPSVRRSPFVPRSFYHMVIFFLEPKDAGLWDPKVHSCSVEGTVNRKNCFTLTDLMKSSKPNVMSMSYEMEESLTTPGTTRTLKLEFKVSIKHSGQPITQNKFYNAPAVWKKLMDNNLSMLKDETYADFTFIVKNKPFRVHRNILAHASPVLAKLFTANMKESKTAECVLNDYSPESFEGFLVFIYGGKLENWVNPFKMYNLAHYYEIHQLQEICKQELHDRLTVENAIEVYDWANIYSLEALKLSAWYIIKRYIS